MARSYSISIPGRERVFTITLSTSTRTFTVDAQGVARSFEIETGIGPPGPASSGLQPANNLSDLTNATAARGNLGLGSAAEADAADFDPAGSAASAQEAAQAYADDLVVGLLDDRGNYDASGNLFPSSGGSGAAGAILKGDLWTISVAGTLGGVPVTAGDVTRALVDTPGQTASNWAVTENNIGYVPLKSGDNISELANDVGYTNSAIIVKSTDFDAIAGNRYAVTAGLTVTDPSGGFNGQYFDVTICTGSLVEIGGDSYITVGQIIRRMRVGGQWISRDLIASIQGEDILSTGENEGAYLRADGADGARWEMIPTLPEEAYGDVINILPIQKKSASFTALVGARYAVTASSTVIVTDPVTANNGDYYDVTLCTLAAVELGGYVFTGLGLVIRRMRAAGAWVNRDLTYIEGLDIKSTGVTSAGSTLRADGDGGSYWSFDPAIPSLLTFNNLSDLDNAATARENLGLGSAAEADATDFDPAGSASTAQAAAQAYAEGLVVGLLDDRGNHDASGDLFPSTGGSGAAGAILKSDLWTISVAGTLGGVPVTAGDVIRALVDTPGQTAANWVVTENNLGYVPQAASANLSALSGLSGIADRLAYFTGVGTMALATFTSYARTLLGLADAAALRANINVEDGADVTDEGNVGGTIHGATAKATPVDADTVPFIDSEAGNVLKKTTWANIKATLKTYFDTIYPSTRAGVYRQLWIGAAAMAPRTTNGATPETVELATNDIMVDVLDFDTATEQGAGFWVNLGDQWDGGTVKVKVYWTAASGSGTVKWDLAAQSYADSDVIDQALGTEQGVTDTLITANDVHITDATASLTIADATAGEPVYFQIARDVASDTLGVDARLIGVMIQYLEAPTEQSQW